MINRSLGGASGRPGSLPARSGSGGRRRHDPPGNTIRRDTVGRLFGLPGRDLTCRDAPSAITRLLVGVDPGPVRSVSCRPFTRTATRTPSRTSRPGGGPRRRDRTSDGLTSPIPGVSPTVLAKTGPDRRRTVSGGRVRRVRGRLAPADDRRDRVHVQERADRHEEAERVPGEHGPRRRRVTDEQDGDADRGDTGHDVADPRRDREERREGTGAPADEEHGADDPVELATDQPRLRDGVDDPSPRRRDGDQSDATDGGSEYRPEPDRVQRVDLSPRDAEREREPPREDDGGGTDEPAPRPGAGFDVCLAIASTLVRRYLVPSLGSTDWLSGTPVTTARTGGPSVPRGRPALLLSRPARSAVGSDSLVAGLVGRGVCRSDRQIGEQVIEPLDGIVETLCRVLRRRRRRRE